MERHVSGYVGMLRAGPDVRPRVAGHATGMTREIYLYVVKMVDKGERSYTRQERMYI